VKHYNTALEDLFTAVMDERKSFLTAVYILSIATLATSCLAYYAEHEAQPDKFGSIPDAMWWAVITLTTVIERLRQSFNLTREHANVITERLRQERSGPQAFLLDLRYI